MPATPDPSSQGLELVVFSDDWGRHPSSCQHLVRHLLRGAGELAPLEVLWVNTIGTRAPGLTIADLGKVLRKLRQWGSGGGFEGEQPEHLRTISPRMYPGFRKGWQRRLNARQVSRAVAKAIGEKPEAGRQRIALTTLPITADLVGKLGADRWVYYCVDDFSVWPGLDGDVMDQMERELVGKVDAACAVSDTLIERLAGMLNRNGAADAEGELPGLELLTHGVDVEGWQCEGGAEARSEMPTLLFWGLIDDRLDAAAVQAIAAAGIGRVTLAGPADATAPELASEHVSLPGPVPFDRLPELAAAADVLIMPYRDLPVTRAMQPLKLLEYLATYKPVVVRDLPATRDWADCCDLASTAEQFVALCRERADTGLPPEQKQAREARLPGESWSEKARQLAGILCPDR